MNRPVLVAYDGSEDAELALHWATDEAAREGLPVRVVVVDEVWSSPWGGDVWRHDAEQVSRAEKLLSESGVDGGVEQRTGHVTGTLLDLAETASSLVVGSRGHRRGAEVATGSVSQHLARHAPCTVVVVRPPLRPAAGRVVVGLDGSPMSDAALEYALHRAEGTGEVVAAVHGWKEHTPSSDVLRSEPRSVTDAVEERQVLLGESVAGVRERHPDVVLACEAVPVPPDDLLVDASGNASLLVVGSRGRGFFTGMLLGSVSQHVLHRARCPVAVVR